MAKFLLIWLLIFPFSVYADKHPCHNIGIDHCEGTKIICKDGHPSHSPKNCLELTGKNKEYVLSIEKPNSSLEDGGILEFIKSNQFLSGGAFGAILAFLFNYFFYYKTALKHARLTSLASIVSVERSAGDVDAFKFHGITNAKIREAGISKKQLAYLVANFTAGRIHDVGAYRMTKKPFDEDNYRYKMLQQKDTQNAWDLIVKMMTKDEYIDRLENTIRKIKGETIDKSYKWTYLMFSFFAIILFVAGLYSIKEITALLIKNSIKIAITFKH